MFYASHFFDCVFAIKRYFFEVVFARLTPVRRGSSERQQSHGWAEPAGRDSAGSNPILIIHAMFFMIPIHGL